MPYFSIIIPCLNEETALPELIADLKSQDFSDFEVNIVDSYSVDKTVDIGKQATTDSRFHFSQIKERNVSTQRNRGAKLSTGTWLIFLDADSRVPTSFLTQLKQQLRKYPCDACNLAAEPDQKDKNSLLFIAAQNIGLLTMTMVGIPYAVGACFVCRRSVFEKVGGFDPKIYHMEDSELARRIKDAGYSVRMLLSPVYTYSLRRQRKEGTLKIIAANYPYYLKSLVSNEFVTPKERYPMNGGTEHNSSNTHRV